MTKRLSASILDLIKSWGWDFDVVEALSISLLEVKEIPGKTDAWIISSRNSWKIVQEFISQTPSVIYCIGLWLQNELTKAGVPSEIKSFENMKALSADLQNQKSQHMLYFCADNHRAELGMALKNTSISITKVITHESRLAFPVLKKNYDAVFIFSPRSAESLLKNNKFNERTSFVCIGPTTAEYLHGQGITNTFCASYPDTKLMFQEFKRWKSEQT